MATGTLRVQTLTGGVLPCGGVNITLTAADGTPAAEFYTDENGDSTPVELEAPPIELSLQENAAAQPYALYNLTARRADFEPVTVLGLQIFADRQSLEQLDMQPLAGAGGREQPCEIDIPPHHLRFAAAETSSRRPDTDAVPRVLSRVVVPEYITVHLGKPAESAQNVTVSFRSYIKNVASSEIYPTWADLTRHALEKPVDADAPYAVLPGRLHRDASGQTAGQRGVGARKSFGKLCTEKSVELRLQPVGGGFFQKRERDVVRPAERRVARMG